MKIRLFRLHDAEQIAKLFHETVREINSRDYSQSQVQAWAPDNIHFRNWAEMSPHRFTYVADQAGELIGFAELESKGHIGCFYCHKNYQRCGVGSRLYQAIETKALALELPRLFTEASITAKPFFLCMGFLVVKAQTVSCRGELFINYGMEKRLAAIP
jgi:putative acetyltransferase